MGIPAEGQAKTIIAVDTEVIRATVWEIDVGTDREGAIVFVGQAGGWDAEHAPGIVIRELARAQIARGVAVREVEGRVIGRFTIACGIGYRTEVNQVGSVKAFELLVGPEIPVRVARSGLEWPNEKPRLGGVHRTHRQGGWNHQVRGDRELQPRG